MARLTVAQRRRRDIENYLARGGSEDDPLVAASRRREEEQRLREEEEQARIEEMRETETARRAEEEQRRAAREVERRTVERSAPPAAEEVAPREMGRFGALREQMGGEEETTDAQDEYEELSSLQRWADPSIRQRARSHLARKVQQYQGDRSTFGLAAEAARELAKIDKADELFSQPGQFEAKLAEVEGRIKGGQIRSKTAEDYYARTGNLGTRTFGDIISQEESVLPILGGLAGSLAGPLGATAGAAGGALPMADLAYDSAYYEARSAGVEEDEARGFARAMSSSEFLFEALGGKAVSAIGLKGLIKNQLEDRLKTVAGKTVLRTGVTTAAGAAEEGLTTAAQMAGSSAYQATGLASKELEKVLTEQTPRNPDGSVNWGGVAGQIARSAAAGGGQAIGPGAVASTIGVRQDDITQDIAETTKVILNAARVSGAPVEVAKAAAAGADAANALAKGKPVTAPTAPTAPPTYTPPVLQPDLGTFTQPDWSAPVAPPATAPEAAKPKKPTKLTPEQEDPANLLRNLKLASTGDLDGVVAPPSSAPNSATDEDISTAVTRIGRGFGYGDAKAALANLRNGKVTLVRDASQLPANSPGQSAGIYNGQDGKIYVNLQEFKGTNKSLSGVLLHEYAHKARDRGAEGFSKPIAALVGKARGDEILAKLEKMRTSNPIVDRALVAARKAAGNDDNLYMQEAVEYVVESQRMAREKRGPLGSLRTVVEDVSNAVSSRAAQLGLRDMKVTPDTLEYLARQTLREDVKRGADAVYKTPATPLATIAGKNSVLYDEFKKRGLVYKSVDGNEKFVVSDQGMALNGYNPNSVVDLLRQTSRGSAADLIKHDLLFEQYPQAKDITIKVDPTLSDTDSTGYWEEETNTIAISPGTVKKGANPNVLKKILLHELQHFVQDVEGHARGSNANMFRTPEDVDVIEKHEQAKGAIEQMSNVFNADATLRALVPQESPRDHIKIARRMFNQNQISAREYLGEIRLALNSIPSQSAGQRDMADRINRFLANEATLKKSVDKIDERTNQLYMESLGELEAYFTMNTSNLSQDQVEPFPESSAAVGEGTGIATPARQSVLVDSEGMVIGRASGEAVPSGRPRTRNVMASNVAIEDRPTRIVKHGTPATFKPTERNQFGEFSDKYMSSGEGGQAFGWGHYATDEWSTADYHYRQRLAERADDEETSLVRDAKYALESMSRARSDLEYQSKEEVTDDRVHELALQDIDEQIHYLITSIARHRERLEYFARQVEEYDNDPIIYERSRHDEVTSQMRDRGSMRANLKNDEMRHRKMLKEKQMQLKETGVVRELLVNSTESQLRALATGEKGEGETYYVEIPDKPLLANWDASLSQQPDHVKKAVKEIDPSAIVDDEDGTIEVAYNELITLLLNKAEEAKPLLDVYSNPNLEEVSTPNEDWSYTDVGMYSMDETMNILEDVVKRFGRDVKEGVENVEPRSIVDALIFFQEEIVPLEERMKELADKALSAYKDGEASFSPAAVAALEDIMDVDSIKGLDFAQERAPMPGLASAMSKWEHFTYGEGVPTFEEWYRQYADLNDGEQALSKQLERLGVPGHFFQPQSRDFETSNYVIYDPKHKRIVGKDRRDKGQTPKIIRPETYTERSARLRQEFEQAARSGTPMASSVSIEDLEQTASTSWRVVKRMLTPTSGYGHTLNEKRLHVRNESASIASRGEVLGYTLKNAIQKAAKKEGKSESVYRDQMEAQLETVDAQPTADDRELMLNAQFRQHPDLIKAIKDIRDFKWSLTQAHIAQRALDPRKLTKPEFNLYKRMVKNAETYGTRAYLATLGGEKAAEYGRKLLARAKKNPNSAEGKKLSVAIEYLINNGLVIPDRAALEAMTTKKLRVLYGTWVGEGAQLFKGKTGRARMVSKLDRVHRASREELEAKALEVAKELLGQKETVGPVTQYFREAKQNRTILTSRKKMPKELRVLMGEITDPYLKEMLSIARLTQLVTKTNLLNEIFNEGNNVWWNEKETTKFAHKLSGAGYGPLDGKWVTKDVQDMLGDITLYNNSIDQMLADVTKNQSGLVLLAAGRALPVVGKLASWQKVAQLVLSPMAMAYNFVGAFGVVAQNGILNPVTAARGMKDALEVVVSASYQHKSQAMTDRVAKVLMAGVMDSAQVGEFQGKVYQDIFKEIKRLNVDDKAFAAKAMNIVREHLWNRTKNAGQFMKDLYAFMDVWAKVATFYDRERFLTAYYAAEGTPKTEKDIVRQAGYEASATNISYNMAIPLARIAERNVPVFTMFLTYFTEVPRSLAFSYAQVYKDALLAKNATNPKARLLAMKQATSRLMGTGAVTVGLTALVNYMLDDEDEEEQRRRKLDPQWERDNIRADLGKNEEGHDVTFSIGRFDANGPFNELVRRVMRAKEGERADALTEGISDLFVKSKSIMQAAQIFTDLYADAGEDKPTAKNVALRAWKPELTEQIENFLHSGDLGENIISFLDTTFVPAAARPHLDPEQARVDQPNPGMETVAQITRYMGNKPYVRDPDKNLSFRASDFQKVHKELGAEKKELFERAPKLSEGELTTRLNDLIQAERDAFYDLYDAYDGYRAFNRTHIQAVGVFDKKVPKEVATDLYTGEFKTHLLTPAIIDKWYTTQLKAPKPNREQLREVRALLNRVYTNARKK